MPESKDFLYSFQHMTSCHLEVSSLKLTNQETLSFAAPITFSHVRYPAGKQLWFFPLSAKHCPLECITLAESLLQHCMENQLGENPVVTQKYYFPKKVNSHVCAWICSLKVAPLDWQKHWVSWVHTKSEDCREQHEHHTIKWQYKNRVFYTEISMLYALGVGVLAIPGS